MKLKELTIKHKKPLVFSLIILLVIIAPIILRITAFLLNFVWSTSTLTMINIAIIFGIGAIGFNILLGISGQISLGHGALIGIGAYVTANFATRVIPGITNALNLGSGIVESALFQTISFVFVLIISGIVSAVLGTIIGLPAVRLQGYYLAIATLGFGLAINEVFKQWHWFTNGYSGIRVPVQEVLGQSLRPRENFMAFAAIPILVVLVILARNIINSKYGRSLKALRDAEPAAQAMGINIAKYKLLAFTISAFYAGVAGGLYAYFMRFITPHDFTVLMSLNLLVMVVIGGIGTVIGGFLGALYMGVMTQQVGRFTSIAGLSNIVAGITLVIVVMFVPYGIASIGYVVKGSMHKIRTLVTLKHKGADFHDHS